MLILTSPAKTLDFEKPFQTPFCTQPQFLSQSAALVENLKHLSKSQLKSVLEVSDDLAQLNYDRFQKWNPKHSEENSRPAIVAYAGDIYEQIHEYQYTEQQATYLQKSLRIISGLYGLVRPYDLIQPYRLEMKALVKGKGYGSLYEFWGARLTDSLNKEIGTNDSEIVLNLASEEYVKAIQTKNLKARYVNVEFNQYKDGKSNNYGLLAKKARGQMIEFMVQNQIHELNQLEKFDVDGYHLAEKLNNVYLFVKEL